MQLQNYSNTEDFLLSDMFLTVLVPRKKILIQVRSWFHLQNFKQTEKKKVFLLFSSCILRKLTFILGASDDNNLYCSTSWCTLVLQIIKEHVWRWYIAWRITGSSDIKQYQVILDSQNKQITQKKKKIRPFMELWSC